MLIPSTPMGSNHSRKRMKGQTTGKLVLHGLHSLNSGPTEYPLILPPFPFRRMIYSWRAGLFATGEVAAAAQCGHRMLAAKKITLAKLTVHKVQDRWEMDAFGVLLGLKQLCFCFYWFFKCIILDPFGITLRLPA